VGKRTEAGAVKKEFPSHTHENRELRMWSPVHEKKIAGAVSFLRRLRSPEIIHTVCRRAI